MVTTQWVLLVHIICNKYKRCIYYTNAYYNNGNDEFTATTDTNIHLSQSIYHTSLVANNIITTNTNIKLQYVETINSTPYYYIIIEPDNRLLTYSDNGVLLVLILYSKLTTASISTGMTNAEYTQAKWSIEVVSGPHNLTPTNITFLLKIFIYIRWYKNRFWFKYRSRWYNKTSSTLAIDTINENTTNNGVTIDGVELKDSNINANSLTLSGNLV